MEGKARFIFPIIISALIVFVVSGVVTFTNIGFRADFVPRGLEAFVTGWPLAAVLSFVAIPHVRRATEGIVRMIEGQAQRVLGRLYAKRLADLFDRFELILERFRELDGCSGVHNLSGCRELGLDIGIADDLTDVRGDAVANHRRYFARTEQTDQAIELE